MSLGLVIIICLLCAFIIAVSAIIIRSILAPKKIGNIKKLLKSGKVQQAQRAAKSIVAKNPRDFYAHYLLGEAYYQDQKYELAFMEFKMVNENAIFDGSIPEAVFRQKMAILYKKFNQTDKALREYLLLTKIEPGNSENDFNVAQILENQGKTPQAMSFYQKCLAVNPKNANAHSAMGYLLFKSKQYSEAKKEIDAAIRLSPETYASYYYLGKILKENKDFSGAIKAFEKAERDQTLRQKALIERGTCFMAVGQSDNAITEFEHAVKLTKDPSSRESLYARYFLAACYEKIHKIEKAIENWQAVYSRNRSFKDVAAKLNEYSDIQTNDSMKEYLTSSQAQFLEICQKVTEKGLKLIVKKTDTTSYGCSMLVSEQKGDNWMSTRQQHFLLQFHRVSGAIEDDTVRKLNDELKNTNCTVGIICTSSSFSPAAIKFAENRPVKLIDKARLESLLAKSGI